MAPGPSDAAADARDIFLGRDFLHRSPLQTLISLGAACAACAVYVPLLLPRLIALLAERL
jgi:hypothetical protein